jgi:murein DD-endopeptidase MepM/ murein hydrolase activator NlpD
MCRGCAPILPVMRRLTLPVLGIVALLALAAVAVAATTGGGPAPERAPVPVAAAEPGEVVDLSAAAEEHTREHQHKRPAENVTDSELAAIERKIKSRSSAGASPDDGVSPGAPSDKEVREALRQMRNGGEGADPIRRGSGGLIWPVNGQFTSPFGQRWGRLHAGIDLAAPTGRPIRAAASGRVILAAVTGGYGLYTCIDHGDSISTCYAHQSRFGVSDGDTVREGDVIGYVGNTGHSFGAHLHFEVRIGGRPVDPMDYL